MQACDLSAAEARRMIGTKDLSPVELLESCISWMSLPSATHRVSLAADMLCRCCLLPRRVALLTQQLRRVDVAALGSYQNFARHK